MLWDKEYQGCKEDQSEFTKKITVALRKYLGTSKDNDNNNDFLTQL